MKFTFHPAPPPDDDDEPADTYAGIATPGPQVRRWSRRARVSPTTGRHSWAVVGVAVAALAGFALLHSSPRPAAAAAFAPADCAHLSGAGWMIGLYTDLPTTVGSNITPFGPADCLHFRQGSCPAVAAAKPS
jgi:hypothetical protein